MPKDVKGKLREVAVRYAWARRENRRKSIRSKSGTTRPQLAAIRARQLDTFFVYTYGQTLPDDDAGREDAMIMANHLALLADAANTIRQYLSKNCPWMGRADRIRIVRDAVIDPRMYRADTLGRLIGLTQEVRTLLHITTIGAIDMPLEKRIEARKAKHQKADEERRRRAGKKPRREYLLTSKSRAKPWRSEGISRRTWYRRQQRGTGKRPA